MLKFVVQRMFEHELVSVTEKDDITLLLSLMINTTATRYNTKQKVNYLIVGGHSVIENSNYFVIFIVFSTGFAFE